MLVNYFRKGLLKTLIVASMIFTMLLSACSSGEKVVGKKVDYSLSASELAKSFYTEYITSMEQNLNEEELKKIEEKYMTELLIEELTLRTWEMEASAILGVQDGTGFLDKMEVEDSNDEYNTVVRFVVPVEGKELAKNTYEFRIRFKKVGDKKLMDTYDFTWIETDADGDSSKTEYLTKYANKEELTEEDKIKMSNQRKYYEDLFAEGYIG